MESLRTTFVKLDTWRFGTPLLVLLTAAATAAGLHVEVPYLLPLTQAAVAWPFFLAACAAGKPGRAAVKVLIFAATVAAVVTVFVGVNTRDRFADAVPNGVRYRDEMFAFIFSGGTEGEEAHPRQYLPMHGLHFGAFCLLCASTFGFGALALGAYLLDYMSFYVGALWIEAAAHGSVVPTLLYSWAPYAVIRVIGYALTGSGITAWILGPKDGRARALRWIAAGAALAVVDVIAKAFLARGYGRTLLETLTQR